MSINQSFSQHPLLPKIGIRNQKIFDFESEIITSPPPPFKVSFRLSGCLSLELLLEAQLFLPLFPQSLPPLQLCRVIRGAVLVAAASEQLDTDLIAFSSLSSTEHECGN